MKKISIFLVTILSIIVFKGYSKGVEVVNDTIYNEGTPYAIIEIVKVGFGNFDYRVKNLKGEELIYLKKESYEMPNTNPNATAPTKEIYFEVLFLESKQFTEIGSKEIGFALVSKTKTQTKIAQILFDNKLIIDNKIDIEAMSRFIFKYATKYSDYKKELNERGNTIIIVR